MGAMVFDVVRFLDAIAFTRRWIALNLLSYVSCFFPVFRFFVAIAFTTVPNPAGFLIWVKRLDHPLKQTFRFKIFDTWDYGLTWGSSSCL